MATLETKSLDTKVRDESGSQKEVSSTLGEPVKFDDVDVGTIQALGYEQAYRRVFKSLGSICLTLALTSPVSGVMLVAFYQVNYGGYWGLSWGWLIPSIIFFPQAVAVAELCSSMPVNGAFYWWTAALAPPKWARPAAFISGWTNVLSLITTIASFSWAVGQSFNLSANQLAPDWVATNAQLLGISIGVVLVWTALAFLRLERVSLVFIGSALIILVTSIILIVGLPASYAAQGRQFASGSDVFGNYTNYTDWNQGIAVAFTFFSSLWINSAWASPCYIVESTREGSRSAPRAVIWSYLSTAISGYILCLIAAFCITDMDTAAADPLGYPILTLIVSVWGEKCTFVWLFFNNIVGLLGGSGTLVAYSCQIAAFARDGGLPYSHIFAKVDQRTSHPLYSVAILVVGGVILLLFGLSTSASGIIYSLAVMASILVEAIPIGLRIFAGDRFVPGPFNLGRWSIPLHCWAFASQIYCIAMEALPDAKHWTPSTFNYNWVITLFVVFSSIVAYMIMGRRFKGIDFGALDSYRQAARQGVAPHAKY